MLDKEFLYKYLKKISEIKIDLIWNIKIKWDKIINQAIFKNDFERDLIKYKNIFFGKINKKYEKLNKVEKDIKKEIYFKEEIKILLNEINVKKEEINFFKETYDIEANKIDNNYKIENKNINYNKYNKIFFHVTKKELYKNYKISSNNNLKIILSKGKLIELIKYSDSIMPEIKFKFWDYGNFSHNNWILKIPDNKKYNIQNIISLFFHETTHFFRYINWIKNLWFDFLLSDYVQTEEWIAIYNEYNYWNKILDYWELNPYYNICYKILLEDISENEKQNKIHDILHIKWYNRKKSLNYYYRFYKYSQLWSKNLFLKDLIYNSWYNNVKKMINNNEKSYEKIISGRIWIFWIENNIIDNKKNLDSKKYFSKMAKKIKSYI